MDRDRERERERMKGEVFFKSYIRGRKSYQARKTFRNNVVLHGGGQPMKRIETLM